MADEERELQGDIPDRDAVLAPLIEPTDHRRVLRGRNGTECSTTPVADALSQYRAIRTKILRELSVLRIQERVQQAVFKSPASGIELNFYRPKVDEPDVSAEMSNLLSQCNASRIDEDWAPDYADAPCEEEEETDNTHSEDEDKYSEEDDDHCEDNIDKHGKDNDNGQSEIKIKTHNMNNRRSRISKLIDIEAECSNEDLSNEESEADLEDLIDMAEADNESDAAALFASSRASGDAKELERLKGRFVEHQYAKRPQRDIEEVSDSTFIELEDFSEDSVSDALDLDRIEFTDFDQAMFEHDPLPPGDVGETPVAAKAPVYFETRETLFNDKTAALAKLTKKAEKRVEGFKQVKN